jgi:aminoglycoside 3-N-acetyltransferase
MRATRASLARDLRHLGVPAGGLVMVHAALRSVGEVVGGANTIVHALLDVVGAEGTIVAYVDVESFVEDNDEHDAVPVFDKRIATAARDHGVLHEVLRTWPSASRSDHPDAGVVALGRQASWIVEPHPFEYGYGEGSPFERVVEAHGHVLMLGAPLDTITLLHYAEHLARIPDKRVVTYRRLMPGPRGPEWITFEEFDTARPVHPTLPENCFEQIARAYLATGRGAVGPFGAAQATRLDGAGLVDFAVEWIEWSVRGANAT